MSHTKACQAEGQEARRLPKRYPRTFYVDGAERIEGHSTLEAEKSSDSMMGGICVRGIKKHRSDSLKRLDGGQLFR